MREVLIDTETTGLSPSDGNRIIEIAAVEILDHSTIGGKYYCYINPEMGMDEDIVCIHGITNEFLCDKPTFVKIVDGFLSFLGQSTIVAHNAPFDLEFFNAELSRIGYPAIDQGRNIVDTLAICRDLFPGQHNNLDSLIERLGIQIEDRSSHGALLDAELMAEVYIQLKMEFI
jgi:DNA polymerase-3 subunit epsilon